MRGPGELEKKTHLWMLHSSAHWSRLLKTHRILAMASKELPRAVHCLQFISSPRVQPSRVATSRVHCRYESSYRRHIQRLSIPPAPSFTHSPKKASSIPPASHVIFNPPSSAPNVYHTPLKFLPRGDRRRSLYASAVSMHNVSAPAPSPKTSQALSPFTKPGTQVHEAASTYPSGLRPSVPEGEPLPPALKPLQDKKYHLTAPEIAEMKRLRAEDPKRWSLLRLAEKFQCSQYFVQICCPNENAGREHETRKADARRFWGPRKTRARDERVRRRELWGKDA